MQLREISFIEFDKFSINHEYGSYYQSSNYALIMAEKGFDYDYIGMFDDDNNLVAASLILIKKLRHDIKYGYAPKGFLIDYKNKEQIKLFTALVKDYYKSKNIAFIKVNPNIIVSKLDGKTFNDSDYRNMRYVLSDNNYLKLKNNLYFESRVPRFNAIIDLDNADFYKFSKNVKNKINKCERKGLSMSLGSLEDISIIDKMAKKNKSFYDINIHDYYNVFNKDNNIDFFLIKVDYEKFLINSRRAYEIELENNNRLNEMIIRKPTEENISIKMNSDLILLSYKNDILEGTKGLREEKQDYIAGAIVIKHGNTATVILSTYDKLYSRQNPNYFLYYSIINYYKGQIKYLDLNGMTGDMSKDNPYYGLNKFKLGFNPDVYEYIGEHDLIIDENAYVYLKDLGILAKEFNKKD